MFISSSRHFNLSSRRVDFSSRLVDLSFRRAGLSSRRVDSPSRRVVLSTSRRVNVVSSFQLVVSSCQIIVSSCQLVISSSRHGTSRHFNYREDFKTEKTNWTSSSTHVGTHSGSVNSATQRPQIKNTNCLLLRTIPVLFIYSFIYLFYNRHFGYY